MGRCRGRADTKQPTIPAEAVEWSVTTRCFASPLKKYLGRHAEQDLPDLFEVGATRLDLLRERVHVAKAALERAAREDRVDAGCLVGEVCHLDRSLDRVGAG